MTSGYDGVFVSNRKEVIWLLVSGLILLGLTIKISFTSHQFIFGIGHKERPIIQFLIYIFSSFMVYLISLTWLKKKRPSYSKRHFILFWIILVSIAARLIYFPSLLIQETDPYRYIWDGQAVLQGVNPYQYSPQYAFLHGLKPTDIDPDLVNEVYRKVNHPEVKTIYPPLAQILFVFSQWLTPWNLLGWRIMIFITECLILFLLIKILLKLKLPPEGVMLYGWSPLILKEFSNSLHLDVFCVLFLTVMIYALIKKWWMTAFVSLSFVALVKLFSIVLLPLLAVHVYKRDPKAALKWSVMFILILAAMYLPFLSAGSSVWEGLAQFCSGWGVNSGLFGVIRWTVQMLPIPNADVEIISRICAMCIFIGLASVVLLKTMKKIGGLSHFLKAALILLSLLFFLIPTGNPWYFTWIFPFLAVLPVKPLIAFSGLVFLYYLDFYFMYQGQPYLFGYIRIIEYGLFFILLGWEIWKNKIRHGSAIVLFSS